MGLANCPSANELMAFSTGELSCETFEEVAKHLQDCAACETTLHSLPTDQDPWVAALRRPPADRFQEEPQCRTWISQMTSRQLRLDDLIVSAEDYQRLLQVLGDPELKLVAQYRTEGRSIEEIAAKLGYAPRSIKRKLLLIRAAWEKGVTP